MRTSLVELARSFSSRFFWGYPAGLLPFALQRFMQGRRLVVQFGRSRSAVIELTVLLWAFRWRQAATDEWHEWVPIWYHLAAPGSGPDGPARLVPTCAKCVGELQLRRHVLFSAGASFVSNSLASRDAEKALWIARGDLPTDLAFLSRSGHLDNHAWWRSGPHRYGTGGHRHAVEVAAFLRIEPASDITQQALHSTVRCLDRALLPILDVFRGKDPGGQRTSVFADLPVPAPASHGPNMMTGSNAFGPIGEVLDRVIRLTQRHTGEDELNSIRCPPLYIARCAEPGGDHHRGFTRFYSSAILEQWLSDRCDELLANQVRAIEALLQHADDLRNAKIRGV